MFSGALFGVMAATLVDFPTVALLPVAALAIGGGGGGGGGEITTVTKLYHFIHHVCIMYYYTSEHMTRVAMLVLNNVCVVVHALQAAMLPYNVNVT